jgi:four helix bundle protein
MELKCDRDLLVWQKAMDLVIQCYELTEKFPKNEIYGLASQIQRAVASTPTNIA